ncbi:hypothetical protein EYF80_028488 [Liparis tanakae]|uniref:Uncharacterized protein n=1 Tax=Liparis tanakae TaxID=230148 RepID=A0A4Z2H7S1_9TELE|nr:hypothetical protein EYF80_028488 [Liparis tanakae]
MALEPADGQRMRNRALNSPTSIRTLEFRWPVSHQPGRVGLQEELRTAGGTPDCRRNSGLQERAHKVPDFILRDSHGTYGALIEKKGSGVNKEVSNYA